MIKGIIFDMDGVLVNNMEIHVEAFRIVSENHGVPFSRAKFLPTFGKGNEEIFPIIFPEDVIKKVGLKNLADEKEATYRRLAAERIEPAPGLVKFIEDVRSHGIKCAVGSSGPTANVNFVLAKCGVTDKFDAIASGDMVEHAKPDPAVFLLAAGLLGLKPDECLVIEDAFAGIEAANRAGMKVIGMATTHPGQKLAEAQTDLIVSGFEGMDYSTVANLEA